MTRTGPDVQIHWTGEDGYEPNNVVHERAFQRRTRWTRVTTRYVSGTSFSRGRHDSLTATIRRSDGDEATFERRERGRGRRTEVFSSSRASSFRLFRSCIYTCCLVSHTMPFGLVVCVPYIDESTRTEKRNAFFFAARVFSRLTNRAAGVPQTRHPRASPRGPRRT